MDKHLERLKAKSNWHFDTKRDSPPGIESYIHVCNFQNIEHDIERMKESTTKETWKSVADFWKGATGADYDGSAAEREIEYLKDAGADPENPMFDRLPVYNNPSYRKIVEWLGLSFEGLGLKFHNQKTGNVLHTHIDNFVAAKDAGSYTRFVVMLEDWKWGQVFQIANTYIPPWKAGDCFTWDVPNMPHATANIGWWDRPMLQITGKVSDLTFDRIKNASSNLIIDLKGL